MTIECIKGGYYSSGCGLGGLSEESPVEFVIQNEDPSANSVFDFQTTTIEDATIVLHMLNGNDSGAGIRTIADNVGNFDRLELFAKDDTINGEQVLGTFTKTQIDFSLPINADTINVTNLSAANFSPTTINATDINTVNLSATNFTLVDANIGGVLTVTGNAICNSGLYVAGTYQNDGNNEPSTLYVNGNGFFQGLNVAGQYRTTGGDYTRIRGSEYYRVVKVYGETNPYAVEVDGFIKATEFHAYSSIEIKEILESEQAFWPDVEALYDSIEFVKYKYKDPIAYGGGEYYGVIAEQLAQVCPELVVADAAPQCVPNIMQNAIVSENTDGEYKLLVFENAIDDLVSTENEEVGIYCKAHDNVEEKFTKQQIENISGDRKTIYLVDSIDIADLPESKQVFVKGTFKPIPTVDWLHFIGLIGARLHVLTNHVHTLTKRIEALENPTKKRAKKK